MLQVGVFTLFNCGLVTTQDILFAGVLQIGESPPKAGETSKLGGTLLISLFPVGVFTLFNCGLVTTQDILFAGVLQIGESPTKARETSKLGGTLLN